MIRVKINVLGIPVSKMYLKTNPKYDQQLDSKHLIRIILNKLMKTINI